MSNELKPCPCCGGKAEFDYDDGDYHWAFCTICGLSTDTDRHDAEDCRVRLAAVWNRRAPVSNQVVGEPAVPEGFALVPLMPTTEMIQVMADDEWLWEDLLAAAGAITEEQYGKIQYKTRQNDPAAAAPVSDDELLLPEPFCGLQQRGQYQSWESVSQKTLSEPHVTLVYTAEQMLQHRRDYHAHMLRKSGESIDTPEFRELLSVTEQASPDRDDGEHMRKLYENTRSTLIAHINAKLAQARAAGAERDAVMARVIGANFSDGSEKIEIRFIDQEIPKWVDVGCTIPTFAAAPSADNPAKDQKGGA